MLNTVITPLKELSSTWEGPERRGKNNPRSRIQTMTEETCLILILQRLKSTNLLSSFCFPLIEANHSEFHQGWSTYGTGM
ncbi:hypothetical protein AAG906_010902 [Vitis piasezkii]